LACPPTEVTDFAASVANDFLLFCVDGAANVTALEFATWAWWCRVVDARPHVDSVVNVVASA
jgi:hypothetical protein